MSAAVERVFDADVFDALVSKRVYKGAWTVADALAYIKDHAGTLFDPVVTGAMAKSFDQILVAMEEENRRIIEDEALRSVLPPTQSQPQPHDEQRPGRSNVV